MGSPHTPTRRRAHACAHTCTAHSNGLSSTHCCGARDDAQLVPKGRRMPLGESVTRVTALGPQRCAGESSGWDRQTGQWERHSGVFASASRPSRDPGAHGKFCASPTGRTTPRALRSPPPGSGALQAVCPLWERRPPGGARAPHWGPGLCPSRHTESPPDTGPEAAAAGLARAEPRCGGHRQTKCAATSVTPCGRGRKLSAFTSDPGGLPGPRRTSLWSPGAQGMRVTAG